MIRRADELRWERIGAHEAVEMVKAARRILAERAGTDSAEHAEGLLAKWQEIAASGGMKVVDPSGEGQGFRSIAEYETVVESGEARFVTFLEDDVEVWWYLDGLWTSTEGIEADDLIDHVHRENAATARKLGPSSLPPAASVPLIEDNSMFCASDRHRRLALVELHETVEPEAQLAAVLLANTLCGWQIDDVSELIDEIGHDPDATAADKDSAMTWARSWMGEIKEGRMAYLSLQEKLVEQIGRERAQEIADVQSERLEVVKGEARDHALEGLNRARVAAGLPRTTHEEQGWRQAEEARPAQDVKTCPDCAEEVKAAARKCRFCGYEFAADEPRPRGRIVDL